jgi:tetratricopeptide (TPR) repeat protein
MRVLTPGEIVAEVTGGPGQAMDLLETDWHGIPARQRSMRAVFDHSYALLSEGQRKALDGLSVFRGSFTRNAAQAVTGASLRELAALVDMSLLQRTSAGHYALHELLRQYAAEKLGASEGQIDAARDRHAAYYAGALQDWAQDLKGSRDRAAQTEIEAEFEDVRAAWEWAIERGRVGWLDQALEGLYLFCWYRRLFADGEAMTGAAAEALETQEAESPAHAGTLRVLAKLLAAQSWFRGEAFGWPEADDLAQKSAVLLEQPDLADVDVRFESAFAVLARVRSLGRMRGASGELDYAEANELSERSLALYQALGDRLWVGWALKTWAIVSAYVYGDWAGAKEKLERALALFRPLGNHYGVEGALMELGGVVGHLGQFEGAVRLYRQILAMRRDGSEADLAGAFLGIGLSLSWCGRYAEAVSVLDRGITIYAQLGVTGSRMLLTYWLAWSEVHLGQYEEARTVAQTALDRCQVSDLRRWVPDAFHVLSAVALTEGAHEEAWRLRREGHAVALETSFGPLALGGYAARGLGRADQSAQLLWQGFQQAAGTKSVPQLLTALPGVALALADRGEVERAVQVYALATRYGMVANSRWFEDVAGRQIAAAAVALPPDVVAAAQERGRAGDPWATVQELLVELERDMQS